MIFKNRNIGTEVTIDLDIFYYYFVRPESEISEGERPGITLASVRERIRRLIPIMGSQESIIKNGPWGLSAQYRRSSNDHVHVKITFLSDILVLDAFMIRAFMLDDQTRLELDLARYLLTDDLHEMNRCFDEKATIDGVKKSGPWIPLQYDRENFIDLMPEARADWEEYTSRWEQFVESHPRLFNRKPEDQRTLGFV